MAQNGEYFQQLENFRDPRVMAKILGVDRIPTDKNKNCLVHIKKVDVPRRRIPRGYFAVIHTPRVSNCSRGGVVLQGDKQFQRGADDSAYKNHPALQRLLPRCYSILRIFQEDDGLCVAKHILQGYYKFGGTAKDEDSHISTSGLFEQAPLHLATRVVLSEKSNGKAAVYTMFQFQDELYLFAGSKSMHYVIRVDPSSRVHDLRNIPHDFAAGIVNAFFNEWDRLSEENRQFFAAHMIGAEHDDGYTACGEYEDGKHMVPLPPGSKNIVKMFGLVSNRGAIPEGETFCEDVVSSIDWFKKRGFPVIHVETKPPDEVKRIKKSLRAGRMSEGWVLHYQMKDKKTDTWVTIAVEKYKKEWYILLRVVREFLKRPPNGLRDWEHSLWERLMRRNTDFLHLPNQFLKIWYELLCKFIQWFLNHGYDRNTNIIDINPDSEGMGAVWCRFIEETGENDDFLEPDAELEKRGLGKRYGKNGSSRNSSSNRNAARRDDVEQKSAAKKQHSGVLVVFQGLPGIGKSHVTDFLVGEMEKLGVPAIGLEQDPFAKKFGLKQSGKKCQEAFNGYLRDGKYKVVFLQRNNANLRQFLNYARDASRNNWATHVVTPKSILDTAHLVLVCLQSVRNRKDHPTFNELDISKQIQITLSFLGAFKAEGVGDNVDFSSVIDWLNPGSTDAQIPEKVQQYFDNYVSMVRRAKNPFAIDPLPGAQAVAGLGLDTEDYQQWRRTGQEIAAETAQALIQTSLKHIVEQYQTSPPTATTASAQTQSPTAHSPRAAADTKSTSLTQNISTSPVAAADDELPNKNALYIALKLDETEKQKLRDTLHGLEQTSGINTAELAEEKMHHLTLIFKTARNTRADLWTQLSEMEGRKLCILVTGFAISPGRICCFACELFSEVGVRKGESLLRLVESGHPHVTAMHKKGVSPVQSLELLKRLASRKTDKGERYVRLKPENFVPVSAIVTVFQQQQRNFGGRGRGGRSGGKRYRKKGGR